MHYSCNCISWKTFPLLFYSYFYFYSRLLILLITSEIWFFLLNRLLFLLEISLFKRRCLIIFVWETCLVWHYKNQLVEKEWVDSSWVKLSWNDASQWLSDKGCKSLTAESIPLPSFPFLPWVKDSCVGALLLKSICSAFSYTIIYLWLSCF